MKPLKKIIFTSSLAIFTFISLNSEAEISSWDCYKLEGAKIIADPLIGDVKDAVYKIIAEIKSFREDESFAIAFGGETTVKLIGNGRGGRNQELAIRFAIEADKILFNRQWCFLSGGTDGIDGPTDAAGGLVDNGTLSRIKNNKKSVKKLLENNDSYEALRISGDLIFTGATGTNVADLQLLIVGKSET